MAVMATITTPTLRVSGGVYSLSVEATFADGATALGVESFSTTATKTDTTARLAAATALADAIRARRAELQIAQNATAVLAQIKTTIEGLL